MPDPTRFDSGSPHVVINVAHPDGNGRVDSIAVPADTPVPELHAALVNSDYHIPSPQPTADGAVENSEDFKKTARDAWGSVLDGKAKEEAGWWTGSTGRSVSSGKTLDEPTRGHMSVAAPPTAIGVGHTHDNAHQEDPSQDDIDAAKKAKKTIWVVSRSGLYSVDPSGNVSHLYQNSDWMNKK
jgi:hypothetical protein